MESCTQELVKKSDKISGKCRVLEERADPNPMLLSDELMKVVSALQGGAEREKRRYDETKGPSKVFHIKAFC